MRSRHVPGPYVLAREDVSAAHALVAQALPLIADVCGFDRNTEYKLQSLFRADYEYLKSVLADGNPRKTMTLTELAARANVSRSSLYDKARELRVRLEECSVAITMLLSARGVFCDFSLWIACELASPVGRDARGPGIHGQRQDLIAIARAGGDMVMPAVVSTPSAQMAVSGLAQTALATQLEDMLRPVIRVANSLTAYHGSEKLGAFGLTPSSIADELLSTLLVPELHAGPRDGNDWSGPVNLDAESAANLAAKCGLEQSIVESDDTPSGASGWIKVQPARLRRLAGLVCSSGLDIAFRPSSVTYSIRIDSSGIHRYQIAAEPGERAVSTELSYTLTGFDLSEPRQLARAIAYVEFMATSPHVARCAQRFGDQLTPSLLKAHDDDQRGLLRALRSTFNAALLAVGREREATDAADPAG